MSFQAVTRLVKENLENRDLRTALERATREFEKKRARSLSIGGTMELFEEVALIKERSLRRIRELIKIACENLRENGVECILASTGEEALEIIGRIVGSGKLVVMAKSLTANELGLREYLERIGNTVFETDLGELLVQLAGEPPQHILAPAIHMTRERAAELISRATGRPVDPNDIDQIGAAARAFLREKFVAADVGISGANVIAADSGMIFIIENEGNARLVTGLPPVHIVVAGIEKIVENTLDAFKVVLATARSAGLPRPSYINIISGPSSSADIEQRRIKGVHGPREVYVVLVDNGRMRALEHPVLWEALKCLRCGACITLCPIYQVVGGAYGSKYFGGIGVAWTAIVEGLEKAVPLAYMCSTCMQANMECPVKIDIVGLIREVRRMGVEG